jgi:hypothetical protein
MRQHGVGVLCIVAAALLVGPTAAPSQMVQYGYDTAGRLNVVADARGDLAVYEYDAVGNLLSIQRVDVDSMPDAVVVALIAPGAARAGTTISLFGKGFAGTPRDNVVTFNGARADVLFASATRVLVVVPPAATTGPITLTSPHGAGTSSAAFRILGALDITPPTALVAPGGSVRFTATGAGDVRWSVQGLAGGDARHGTIGVDGLYVAPLALPRDGVHIEATSLDDPAIQATARVAMIPSRPWFLVAPTAVSVAVTAPRTTLAMAAPLTVRIAPVVTRITPAHGTRGDALRVTVIGTGFDGATQLEFLTGTVADPAIEVAGLAIGASGTEATADVTIAAGAALGPRVVRMLTPTGSSGAVALGDNLFTVR